MGSLELKMNCGKIRSFTGNTAMCLRTHNQSGGGTLPFLRFEGAFLLKLLLLGLLVFLPVLGERVKQVVNDIS